MATYEVKALPGDIYASFTAVNTNPLLVVVYNEDGSEVAFVRDNVFKDFKAPNQIDPSKLKAPHSTLQLYTGAKSGNPTCLCLRCDSSGCYLVPCPCPP